MVPKTQKRVTSSDVAREAGVARSTVSYVLNRTPHQTIPDGTRRRVLDAAARLGYTPSAAARTLKRGRSDVVLCIVKPWPLGSASGLLLAELTAGFDAVGLTLVTHIEGAGVRGVEAVWNEIAPAAVLTYSPVDPDAERTMRAAGVQCVAVLFSGEPDGSARFVRPDARIGLLQAQHLVAAGHARIGYAYPEPPTLRDFAEPRLEGVRAACAEAGIAAPEVRTVALDAESAAAAIEHWRGMDDPVTAVCAYNDEVAQALIAGARLAGVGIPNDLAVIGADDIPTARLASPPLTTIAIDHAAEARRIVHDVTSALREGVAVEATDPADLFTTVVRESA
ncbi:LacI family DNA-binding transcriptional regulator [Zhihengliuella alba]|uniref:LacI family DNA-binding transcriptional regulator n=1 Tax=Zhihengliuella alba TaxID=547018 RepID=A0ABP7CPW1_9MICC